MNTAWTQRLSFGLALTALIFAGQSWAADDKSTVKAVTDMFGLTSDQQQDKIDYSERPKLVMPPRMDMLPAPRNKEAERPAEWPVDAAIGVRRTDRFARNPNAPPEKPKPSILEKINGPHRAPDPARANDTEGGIIGAFVNLRENRKRTGVDEEDVPARRVLAEPPEGLRTPTQDLSKVADTDKKPSVWNLFGHQLTTVDPKKEAATQAQGSVKTDDKAPPPPSAGKDAAKSDDASAQKSGFLSTIGSMMPSFSKSAEKN